MSHLDVDAGSRSCGAPQGGWSCIATPAAGCGHVAGPRALGMCGVPGGKLEGAQWRVLGHIWIPVGVLGQANIFDPHDGFPTGTTFTFFDIMAALFLLQLLTSQLQGIEAASFGAVGTALIITGHELTISGQ